MLLIPVIDLMQGQVVRAVRGERGNYRPVVSKLVAGSDPVAVAATLCEHCASDRLYAADLDALTGGTPQLAVLRSILQALPRLEFWVDAGFERADAATRLRDAMGAEGARVQPIFASEALATLDDLPEPGTGVLSLDRRGAQVMDRAGCWQHPERWPRRVIVMTLDRVGADAGPDLDTLRAVQARAPGAWLVGAGGIRDAADLDAAAAAGARAWLVASALHDGRLPRVPR